MAKITDIDLFVELITERDSIRLQYNEAVAQMLRPITLTALFQLFQLPVEKVEWGAFDLIDQSIIIVVYVTYKSSDEISPFLKMMDEIARAAPTAKRRMLKLAVPLQIAFSSVDVVKQFLYSSAENMLKPQPVNENTATEFDTTKLTEEQLRQLLLYRTLRVTGEK